MAGFLHTRARHSLASSAAGQRCGYQNQPNPTQPHSSSEAQSFLPYQRKNDNEMLDIHLFFPCNLASPGLRLHTLAVAGQRSKAPINPKMFVRHHDGTCPTGHGHFMATPSLNMYCQTETMRCELYPVPPLLSCSALTRTTRSLVAPPNCDHSARGVLFSLKQHTYALLPSRVSTHKRTSNLLPPAPTFREQSHSDSDSDIFSLSFPSPFPFLLTLG